MSTRVRGGPSSTDRSTGVVKITRSGGRRTGPAGSSARCEVGRPVGGATRRSGRRPVQFPEMSAFAGSAEPDKGDGGQPGRTGTKWPKVLGERSRNVGSARLGRRRECVLGHAPRLAP